MNSIATASERELGGAASVLVRQRRDHVDLDRMLEKLPQTSGPGRDQLLNRLSRLVFPHAFAEESVLWPTIRRVLPEGEALTLEIEQEHQEINELWTTLERTPDAERDPLLARITTVLREDVRDEEDRLFPMLRERLDDTQLRRLGYAWEAVRRTAPTRPHPVVARRPPGNALAAVPLTVLDRARDVADAGARRVPSRTVRRGLASSSAVLARAAGLVENLPPLTRGEDPSTARSRAGGRS
ncbi:hemerythrin domain-containing protein [Rhodococcoides corynebacterioides]|uniref:Hemerythrin domain-containing protein n=1 Tax=Rhodococcoides corynebacterioides TaxID=53972 RepID=A0ABS7P961_9NOCA|nr:hemerythrin domain-containing protein [Rhodococcus corynebacterioides]MBY6368576.1 hemerythrin domain-containing protein [Rhodococcus corynebacterioides]MBY6409663.1 hemerythrin domain-containing protein [Rhodococcus corynebacterioides]